MRRIVCLVPSLTKTLCDLGLTDEIVGCTTFCVDPPSLHRSAANIGGTKDPVLEKIAALKPTHIIANEEENRLGDVTQCQDIAPTLITFPRGPEDVSELFASLGNFLEVKNKTTPWQHDITALLEKINIQKNETPHPTRSFLYLIWQNPYMAVAEDTYISRFLELLPLKNIVSDTTNRYPTITTSEMTAVRPNVIFLSSEPFPFRQRQAEELGAQLAPSKFPMRWIDGKICSWYGSLTKHALELALESLQKDELVFSRNF